MSALAVSIAVAMVVVGQADGGPAITGIVVDRNDKPVAAAEIRLSCGMAQDGTTPCLGTTRTDSQGRFRVAVPPRDRLRGLSWYSAVWACRPGLAMTSQTVVLMQNLEPAPLRLVLRELSTRTVTVRGPSGQPVKAVRITPRSIHSAASQMGNDMIPDELAQWFAATTGADGKAMLRFLAPRDDLVAVRVAMGAIGKQDFVLTKGLTFRKDAPAEYAIALKPTGYLTGRIVDGAGKPIAGVPVEVWSRGEVWLPPTPVQLPGEPLRTAADGSFQTPPGLLIGSSYRVVVQIHGSEPILSDWLTAGEMPLSLPPLMLQALRTIRGRVTDRQGQPMSGAEVFQAGDGPELTSTRTDAQGRFSLGGFRAGSVFMFVRGAGCRFYGQMVSPQVEEVTLVLSRTTEQPARSMPMLPAPIPQEESQELARQLIEPYVAFALAKGNDSTKYWALKAIVPADPIKVLEQLDSIKFESANSRDLIRNQIVRFLARTDIDEASAVAESIADPGQRAGTLIELVDSLPDTQRARKLSILAEAALQAKAAPNLEDRLFQMGEVAVRWHELGEIQKAKALFAEGRTLAGQLAGKSDQIQGLFAVRLSRVDLPAALAIVTAIPDKQRAGEYLGEIAGRLGADDPALAEQILGRIEDPLARVEGTLRICLRMAAVDPARARRIAGQTQGAIHRTQAFLFLALGLKARDPHAAVEAFQAGLRELDRYSDLETEDPSRGRTVAELLPLVERIDPALVPEVFWRAVALRPPTGDPRKEMDSPSARLAEFLAFYDGEVASVLFQPVRAELEKAGDSTTDRSGDFLTWSLLDPRAAAARVQRIGVKKDPDPNSNWALSTVVESLAETDEARWRWFWRRRSTLGELLFDRDGW